MKTVVGSNVSVCAGVCLGLFVLTSSGQPPEVSVYDTGAVSAEALSGDALAKKEGWAKIAEGKKTPVKGAAVLANAEMAVVLRPKSDGVDVYGISTNGTNLRAHIVPMGDADGMTLTSARAVSEADNASVEAVYKTGKGTALTVTYSLGPANPILKTQAGAGVLGQRIEAPTRLGVMSDFFADDIVVDARKIPADRTELPSDNQFMQMLDNGNSIIMEVWDKNLKDIEMTLAGQGDERKISGVELAYGGGSIWIAVLEKKGVWTLNEKNVPLDNLKFPFKATWKGALVVYPIGRTRDTPMDEKRTIMDVLRNSMGTGPCESVMDVDGAKEKAHGVFTCANAAMMPAIFTADWQKDEFVFVDRCLYQTEVFVKAISDRIGTYVAFRGELLKYLDEQKKAQPELADFIKRLEAQTRSIPAIKLCNLPKVMPLVERIRIDAFADMPKENIVQLTCENSRGPAPAIADYGEEQDQCVARCRTAVKQLRLMATMEMMVNPKSAGLANEVRKRTQQVLRGGGSHEGVPGIGL